MRAAMMLAVMGMLLRRMLMPVTVMILGRKMMLAVMVMILKRMLVILSWEDVQNMNTQRK